MQQEYYFLKFDMSDIDQQAKLFASFSRWMKTEL
jgi:hypothetical protein